MNEVTTPCVSEQPAPNKLCPILMLCPPKTGTYGDIVCLQDKCAVWHDTSVIYLPTGDVVRKNGYCGLAGKP